MALWISRSSPTARSVPSRQHPGVRGGTIEQCLGIGEFRRHGPAHGYFRYPVHVQGYRPRLPRAGRQGVIGQDVLDKLGEFGLKGLAYWDNGWRQLTNNRNPAQAGRRQGYEDPHHRQPGAHRSLKLLGGKPRSDAFG